MENNLFLLPLFDEESFIAWLADHIAQDNVDEKATYMLNLAAGVSGCKNMIKRLPDTAYKGICTAGREAVILGLLCRAFEHLSEKGQTGKLKLNGIIRSWAEKDGCWIGNTRSFFGNNPDFKFFRKGGEARVYNSYESVIKTISASYYNNFQQLLDRIAIHDAVFPESSLTVTAIGQSRFRGLQLACRQDYVQGAPLPYEQLVKEMARKGFRIVEGGQAVYEFYNDHLYVGDLNERNALADKRQEVRIIDCYAKLNTPHDGYRGKWVIPDIKYSYSSKEKLNKLADEIVPFHVNKKQFLANFSTVENNLSMQILDNGRYNGTIDVNFNGVTKQCLVSINPENREEILLLDSESVRKLTIGIQNLPDGDLLAIRQGKTILVNDIPFAFSISRGRIDKLTPQPSLIPLSSVPGMDIPESNPQVIKIHEELKKKVKEQQNQAHAQASGLRITHYSESLSENKDIRKPKKQQKLVTRPAPNPKGKGFKL